MGHAKFPAQLCEAARTIPIFTSNRTRTPFLCHENCTARHVSGETEIGLVSGILFESLTVPDENRYKTPSGLKRHEKTFEAF